MSQGLEELFAAVHDFLSSTIRAAGPWAVPMVVATAGLVAMANRSRLVSGFGVLLTLITIGCIAVVIAFQRGRI